MSEINLINLDSVSSTNSYAKENINKLILPSLIIANTQTAGRGRQGKSFFSPVDTGLYMTLIFDAPQNCTLLTPAAAVSVCKTLCKYDINPKIKWVNDIFINERKICGILTEFFSYNGKNYIILGIGINLTTTVFPDDLKTAGSANIECNKTTLAFEISEEILQYIRKPDNKYIISEYKSRLFILGKQITYSKNNVLYCATAEDINNECNLIVKKDDGTTDILSSGEISIKF